MRILQASAIGIERLRKFLQCWCLRMGRLCGPAV